LQPAFSSNSIGKPFTELQSVDSTNNYALSRVHEGMAQHGACFFAHEQTAGKGQRGKSWASEKGANLILSIVLKPDFLHVFQQFQVSACAAVAAQKLFSKYAGEATKIKWPNDLYWQDRKAGGVLIENIISSSDGDNTWEWAVMGIGININQTRFSTLIPNAVSLRMITGRQFDPVELSKELCNLVNELYGRLRRGEFHSILEFYNQHLYKKDEITRLKKDTRIFETTIRSVTENGELVTSHSMEERFHFGEVAWL
jgi:BirA family transcriptional regulator, biotin operon repressor / biotin---[acetyl-CoA-carboxylase] ligase